MRQIVTDELEGLFERLQEVEADRLPSLQEIERTYIQFVLKKAQGRKDRASRILGINRRTLYRKEREYETDDSDLLARPLAELAVSQM